MQAPEMIVAIVAMSLGYSLLKHIFTPREVKIGRMERYRKPGKGKWKKQVTYEEPVVSETTMESNGELKIKADELLRRLSTLEEIMTSEKHAERS
jgi:hypothetical protein